MPMMEFVSQVINNHIEDLIKMGLVSKKERKNKNGLISNLYFLHLK